MGLKSRQKGKAGELMARAITAEMRGQLVARSTST